MRPSRDQVFIDVCEAVARRSTCDRKHVGCVITIDGRIVATGYNGSLPREPHCDDPSIYWQCSICGTKMEEEPRKNPYGHWICERTISCLGYPVYEYKGDHLIIEGHCVRTVHAEENAIAQCAYLGVRLKDSKAILYCNTRPCWSCFKIIISAGIQHIVYTDDYGKDTPESLLIDETLARNPHIKFIKYEVPQQNE